MTKSTVSKTPFLVKDPNILKLIKNTKKEKFSTFETFSGKASADKISGGSMKKRGESLKTIRLI